MSKNKPQKSGYYWYSDLNPEICYVIINKDKSTVMFYGSSRVIFLNDLNETWSEQIKFNETRLLTCNNCGEKLILK